MTDSLTKAKQRRWIVVAMLCSLSAFMYLSIMLKIIKWGP